MNFSFKLLAVENQPRDTLNCNSLCQGSICFNSLSWSLCGYRHCGASAGDPDPSPGRGAEGGCAGLGRCCRTSACRGIAGAAGEEQPAEQGCRGSKGKWEERELW